jgi:leucyl aminopeptidase
MGRPSGRHPGPDICPDAEEQLVPEVRLAPAVADARAVEPVEAGQPALARLAAGRLARSSTLGALTVDGSALSGARLTAFVEGLVLGAYRFSMRSTPPGGLRSVELAGASDAEALERGLRNARATTWARDLTNTPASVKTPDWLARQAAQALCPLGVEVAVRDEAWLVEHGFGGVLAVGGGSVSPPRLIEASWRPRGARADRHPVLVGKGITFDTGGINLKPGASMRMMHTDMAGGAAALAALRAVAEQKLPVRVTVLVPAAENTFGGGSYRPSDVVRHYGGRTSEINNTDAEGRVVLADAIAYAVARLDPTVVLDVATLTGAMKVALGMRTGGFFATSDRLAAALTRAADRSGESMWRLPLDHDYLPAIHSDIADALQAPGNPGAITAALFLEPFAGSVPWAHLDIAGPARADKDDGLISRGATGFGARLLLAYLESLA